VQTNAQAAIGDPGIKAYFQKEAEKRKLPNAYTAACLLN
jgi:hypothetical protein